MIADLDSGCEKATQTHPVDSVVELNVLTRVERFVEEADPVKNRTPVGHRHTLWPHELLDRGVNVGIRMMPQTRRPCSGDCLLDRGCPGNVEGLGTAQAVGATPREGVGKVSEVVPVVQLAVAVDDCDQLASGVADTNIPSGA